MDKFTYNGVEFCNFGSNNYSNGMECITCYPMPDNFIQRVLNGEFHGIWLNPSADCSDGTEFYGVFGTAEQYYGLNEDGFLYKQRESQIAKRYFNLLGGYQQARLADKEEQDSADAQARAEYVDWWSKIQTELDEASLGILEPSC